LSWLNNVTAFLPMYTALDFEWDIKERPRVVVEDGELRAYRKRSAIDPNVWLTARSNCILGVVHFVAMSAFGIWMWKDVSTFDINRPNWIAVYSMCTIPLLNYIFLLLPCLVLAAPVYLGGEIYFSLYWWLRGIPSSTEEGTRHQSYRVFKKLMSVAVGPVILVILIIIGLEGTIAQNTVTADEHKWSFGQTLAVFLVILPALDVWGEVKSTLKDKRDGTHRTDEEQAETKEVEPVSVIRTSSQAQCSCSWIYRLKITIPAELGMQSGIYRIPIRDA
jgi:hypothetical protein